MVKPKITLITPLVLLPLFAIDSEQPAVGRAAWVTTLMAVYWATEALPMAVTSLLPLVLFPALGATDLAAG